MKVPKAPSGLSAQTEAFPGSNLLNKNVYGGAGSAAASSPSWNLDTQAENVDFDPMQALACLANSNFAQRGPTYSAFLPDQTDQNENNVADITAIDSFAKSHFSTLGPIQNNMHAGRQVHYDENNFFSKGEANTSLAQGDSHETVELPISINPPEGFSDNDSTSSLEELSSTSVEDSDIEPKSEPEPKKKNERKSSWTPDEDGRLMELAENCLVNGNLSSKFFGVKRLEAKFTGRSLRSCIARHKVLACVPKAPLVLKRWTPEEDEILLGIVSERGTLLEINKAEIQEKLKGRTYSACQSRMHLLNNIGNHRAKRHFCWDKESLKTLMRICESCKCCVRGDVKWKKALSGCQEAIREDLTLKQIKSKYYYELNEKKLEQEGK